MQLKVCGLRQTENIKSLLALQPDYLGFIFYKKSKRYAEGMLDERFTKLIKFSKSNPKKQKKTGVFVNENLENIKSIIEKYGLNALQLHGDEPPEFCRALRASIHPPTPLKGGQESAKTTRPSNEEPPFILIEKKGTKNKKQQKAQAVAMSPLEGGRGVNDGLEIIKVFSVNDEFDFNKTKIYEDVCDLFLFDTKGKERGGNGIAFNWDILNKYDGEKPFFLSGGIGPENVAEIKKIMHPKLYGVDINSCFEIGPGLKDVEMVEQFVNELFNK